MISNYIVYYRYSIFFFKSDHLSVHIYPWYMRKHYQNVLYWDMENVSALMVRVCLHSGFEVLLFSFEGDESSNLRHFLVWGTSRGSSTNDVTHLGGRGICPKVTLLHKPIYQNGWQGGRDGSKISKKWAQDSFRSIITSPSHLYRNMDCSI